MKTASQHPPASGGHPPTTHSTLLDTSELSERIGLKPRRIRDLAARGVIPEISLGPRVKRYYWPDVLNALKANPITE